MTEASQGRCCRMNGKEPSTSRSEKVEAGGSGVEQDQAGGRLQDGGGDEGAGIKGKGRRREKSS
jgi:hypothetical protein